MNQYLDIFAKLGPEGFSKGIATLAPFFETIDPEVTVLEPKYCELMLRKQRKVENHLGTIHAIAMCNAAELVGGVTTEVSTPEGTRWIPEGMTVAYIAKAKTDLRVVCNARDIDFSHPGLITVPVKAYDTNDTLCFTADINMNVKHT
jgi:acyl-coenzyme A thioesterase PaaI-like protein